MKELFVGPLIALGLLDLFLVWLISKVVKLRSGSQMPAAENSESNLTKMVYIFTVVAGIAGLTFRLYGFNRSLWLDEFGTLWAVEGSFSQLLERVDAFQGQSAFYYLLAWIFVHSIGESEFTLRVLSLILGLATIYGIYVLGDFLHGKNVGLVSASLLCLSSSMVQSSSEARPYALALLMAVIMFYGFARAARRGDYVGRCLFILGGAGLFSAHYVLILVVTGIALGYILFPRLRSYYPVRQFAFDASLQLLFVSWCLPHMFGLWSRRESLSWLGSTNYLVFVALIGPFVVLALAPYMSGNQPVNSHFQRAMTWVFALAISVQIGSLHLLAYFGTNLLHARYMIVAVIPAAVLAATAVVRLPRYLVPLPLGYWLFCVAAFFIIDFKVYGSFSGVGFQDWRKAVACLDDFMLTEPETLVLYRSGFVEEDTLINGQTTPATVSPLRSPGRQPVSWNLIELTYSWVKPGREAYFARTVEPAVQRAPVFYFITCAGCFNQITGQYPDALVAWIEKTFPGRFQTESIPGIRGVTLIRFVSRFTVPVSESLENTPVPSFYSTTFGVHPSPHRRCS